MGIELAYWFHKTRQFPCHHGRNWRPIVERDMESQGRIATVTELTLKPDNGHSWDRKEFSLWDTKRPAE